MTETEPDPFARADVWKTGELVSNYLRDVRGGIPYGADQIAVALRVAASWVPDTRCILDLGCGDGIIGAASRDIWPDAELTLLDFSPDMLAAARTRFADDRRVHIVNADFGDPGWIDSLSGDRSFDLVLSAYAIHHQTDERKRALYREIATILRPGGLFINIEHVASVTPAVATLNDDLFIDTLEQHQRRLGSKKTRDEIAQAFYFRPDKAANELAPVEEQLVWLRESGFTDVDCFFKIFELAVFGGRLPTEE